MTSDFVGFSISDFIHYIYFPLHYLERASIFLSFFWYDAVFDWGLNPGPPALEASTLPLGYRENGITVV